MHKKDFNRLQYIDNLKNEYCFRNNILLFRFNNETNLETEIIKIVNSTKGNK